ncbi:dTDP-glucose 4,6-dehydratase [Nocardiopsis mangrovi]|uniref:dTDP-glucose 4,6-dehydratase n=1 Tax=Nocardiopsis mangrovi TaxID=1179818 RepID=A0ABV9DWG7_9ACTN
MRVLITGGAGFIGSHYARTMLAGGYPGCADARVTVLDQLTYAGDTRSLPMDHPRLRFVHGDVCDPALLRRVVPGHDAVVHCAAESHADRPMNGSAEFIRTNILGTHTLLEACRVHRVGPVVVVSTDEVYGPVGQSRRGEGHPPLPDSPYSASKAAGDLVALAYARTHGLDVRVTRGCDTYGPYQHVEQPIPAEVTGLLGGAPPPAPGGDRDPREWVHVDDHCRAVHLVLTRGRAGGVYNVGGGTVLDRARLARILAGLCGGVPGPARSVEDGPGGPGADRGRALDDRRIRAELGFRNLVPFAWGIAETVHWYRSNPGWWEPLLRESVL